MDVQGLRDYVRNHLEMDDEELPDLLLNIYLQDGFEQTVARDNRWPRYEKSWHVAKTEGTPNASLPDDVLIPSIMSVMAGNTQLAYITQENAERAYSAIAEVGGGQPAQYSIWDRQLVLWPAPDINSSFDLFVRGYRQPIWSNEASTIPDVDPRLHPAIAYYAMSLVYSAQEDEILEGVHLARWDRDVLSLMRSITDPPRMRPLVMNGGGAALGGASYVINPPAPEPEPAP